MFKFLFYFLHQLSNVLFVSLAVFSVYYTLHGVLQERATEILVLCIATFVVLVYLIVNYAAGKKGTVKLVSCHVHPQERLLDQLLSN